MVGFGLNVPRNDPKQVSWCSCSRHAEQVLGRRCDLLGTTVYVARVKGDGSLGLARPCKYCLPLLSQAGVRRLVWSDASGGVVLERLLWSPDWQVAS